MKRLLVVICSPGTGFTVTSSVSGVFLGGAGLIGSAAVWVEPAAIEPIVAVPWIVSGPPVKLKLTPTPFSSTLPPLETWTLICAPLVPR